MDAADRQINEKRIEAVRSIQNVGQNVIPSFPMPFNAPLRAWQRCTFVGQTFCPFAPESPRDY